MAYQLLEPILEGGIRNSHFFNGRLLTADALRQEQDANRDQRRQLGRAIGQGVVEGLSVSLLLDSPDEGTVLRVTAGLAINGKGEALDLPETTDVELLKMEDPRPTDAGLFTVCVAPATGVRHTGKHAYILVLAPASGYRERAPMYDLSTNGDSNGRANGCGYRYAVEGVQFRMVRIDLTDRDVIDQSTENALTTLMGDETAAGQSLLRNRLAHLCLGTAEVSGFAANLFSYLGHNAKAPIYGLVDRLLVPEEAEADADMSVHLSICDVPLALIYWTPVGVQFVDMWSVRRRLMAPYPSTAGLPMVSDRRLAEGEAAFLQFQAQVAHMTRPSVPQADLIAVNAGACFRYLPAAGIIPLAGKGAGNGFNFLNFFKDVTVRRIITEEGEFTYTYINGAKVSALLRRSLHYPPIDLEEKEFLWLYIVRENIMANKTQMYVIFTSGHVPFVGDAQYDLNRWDYGNYGPIVDGTFVGE